LRGYPNWREWSCVVAKGRMILDWTSALGVGRHYAVREDLSAAGHITSSGVIRPGVATFAALKRFAEADPTHGGWLILSIGEACFSDCRLSDGP
jgi:hypothetical protein